MNLLASHTSSKKLNPDCADVISVAEKELAAFFNAVAELFGSEQAQRAADDWLHALEVVNDLPASSRDWQLITGKATAQLAGRINSPALSAKSQSVRRKPTCVFSSQVLQAL